MNNRIPRDLQPNPTSLSGVRLRKQAVLGRLGTDRAMDAMQTGGEGITSRVLDISYSAGRTAVDAIGSIVNIGKEDAYGGRAVGDFVPAPQHDNTPALAPVIQIRP